MPEEAKVRKLFDASLVNLAFGQSSVPFDCAYFCSLNSFVMHELLETERDYVRDLGLIVEVRNVAKTSKLP